jgi:hypothetical protein
MRTISSMTVILVALGTILPTADANAQSKPIVYVTTELAYPKLVPISARVSTVVTPPRFDVGYGIIVSAEDSEGNEIHSYGRPDPRIVRLERAGGFPRQDGSRIVFSTEVLPRLRTLQAYSTTGDLILSADLGPVLVSACARGELSDELCDTFDSDGDGCRDIVDSAPLMSETDPPVLAGSLAARRMVAEPDALRTVSIAISATDNCSATPEIMLEAVTVVANATNPELSHIAVPETDAQLGTPDRSFSVRSPSHGERTYNIVYRAVDRAGNVARLVLQVTLVAREPKRVR